MVDLPPEMGPPKTSAVYDIVTHKLSDKTIHPHLSAEQIHAMATEANDRNVYGVDAKRDRNGKWIQQGIGSPGHETSNHFASIRRYQGEEAWRKEVAALWKRDPARAEALNLPRT
jgi:hypothetical protein